METYAQVPYSYSNPTHRPSESALPLPPQKRASLGVHPFEQPAKKQSKWSLEENDLIIKLRGENMKWEDISKRLPGRSAISCRLHYQNFLERKAEWSEEKEAKLARLYDRFKKEMWEKVAREMQMPWRAVEAKHWELGAQDMARLAGVNMFSTSSTASQEQSPLPSHVSSPYPPSAEYQHSALRQSFTPYQAQGSPFVSSSRLHPMDPPPRPDPTGGNYPEFRASGGRSPPTSFLAPMVQPRRQGPDGSEYTHAHHYPDGRHLPPLEAQQLPPMRLLTEPRHPSERQDIGSPYSRPHEYRPRDPGRAEEPHVDRETR